MREARPTGLQRAAGDPFLEDFFRRIPRETAQSFTDDQLLAVRMAFATERRRAHALDIRISLPMPFRRMYLVVLAGTERRSLARRRADRERLPLATLANAVFATAFVLVLLAAFLGIAYVLKSALGIDLAPDLSLGLWEALREQVRWLTR